MQVTQYTKSEILKPVICKEDLWHIFSLLEKLINKNINIKLNGVIIYCCIIMVCGKALISLNRLCSIAPKEDTNLQEHFKHRHSMTIFIYIFCK